MKENGPKTKVATPQQTKRMMQKYKVTTKKSLGQNFLIDANILERIVAAAQLDERTGALEIGAGIGALTQPLAESAGRVVAVEIDRRLLPVLKETLSHYDHVSIVHDDVLKTDLRELIAAQFADMDRISVVANLPYYVTTPIVMKLLEEQLPLANIVIMVQKEVAERMTASPGSKQYGSLSIAVQYYCIAETMFTVPKTVFIPQPNVDSAVIRLKVRDEPAVQTNDPQHFFKVVRASFVQRRKTMYDNMRAAYPEHEGELKEWMIACGIEPSSRAETLTMAQFAALSDRLQEKLSHTT